MGATSAPPDYIRLNAVETALGWPLGAIEPGPADRSAMSARTVLEGLVLRALLAGPTFVSFSGGRDSSAVLALATVVARREGLPDPIPLTVSYPGLHETDEAEWQRLVLEHLGLTEHIVITVRGEQTLLGERARASLERRGPLWPAALHTYDVFLDHVDGAQLLTGEGGDEVISASRITPISILVRERRRPRRALVAASARAAVPNALRGPYVRRRAATQAHFPWLRGQAVRALADVEADLACTPLRWDRALPAMVSRRAAAVMEANYERLAAEHDVTAHHPLRGKQFIGALAADGGCWGYRGRTDLMRTLFGDILPDAVLARTTKARFNAVRFGSVEREFARSWDGAGVDADLVDAEVLRSHWLSEMPFGVTGPLLHAAWLAGCSRPPSTSAGVAS